MSSQTKSGARRTWSDIMSEVRQSKKGKNKPAKPNETEQTLRDDKESKQTEGSSEGMEMEPWVDKGKQE